MCVCSNFSRRGSKFSLILTFLVLLQFQKLEAASKPLEVWTLVGATWHWSDLTFIEPSVVKLDYGKVSASDISSFNIAL